jgi:hypothetical protein
MNTIATFSRWALIFSTLALRVVAVPAANLTPEVSVSLRGVPDHTIEVGEPLFVAVRIDVPDERNATVELAPGSGTWADSVEVEISGAENGAPILHGQPAAKPESAIATLDAERAVGGVWFLSSATSGKLVPGEYLVHARLMIHDGTGWKGEAVSDESVLHIVATSAATERVIQRTMALAHEAVLADALQKAARLLDALLTDDPDNIPLLTMRGALCARGGDYHAAMVCVNRAMSRVDREGWTHPPIELFELENQVAIALMTPSVAQVALPDWTRPPASVLARLPDERLPKKTAEPPATASIGDASTQPVGAGVAPALSVTPVSSVSAIAAGSGNFTVVSSSEFKDATIIADPNGLWATSAAAGTQYGKTQYSAAQATGAPNVSTAGNSPNAWCPENKTGGIDWLKVTFAKPVHATEVRVRQNDAAGAITKIEGIEPDGTAHVWWEGVDPYKTPAVREIVWFSVRVPQTAYLVAKVKITLNLASGPGYKEIDAVQLVGAAQ